METWNQAFDSTMHRRSLHLILTAHNVESTIEADLRTTLAKSQMFASGLAHVTVIDQASTDRTLALAELVARDVVGLQVVHDPENNLIPVLSEIPVLDDAVIVLADLTKLPEFTLIEEAVAQVSQSSWNLVAMTSEKHKGLSHGHPRAWRSKTHSLRIKARENIEILALSSSLYRECAVVINQVKKVADEPLVRIYNYAHKNKYRCLVQDITVSRENSPASGVVLSMLGTSAALLSSALL